MSNYIAIDLGASSGRVMLGRIGEQVFELTELHRFPNIPLAVAGHLHWDVEQLWSEIKKGLACYTASYSEPLTSIGVDSWAIDYVLLDEKGQLLELPYHYRDQRTNGLMEKVLAKAGKARIFQETGLQFLPFNTLYQLYSQVLAGESQLEKAATLLLIPDWFHYRLSGHKVVEYTNATTTQCFELKEKRWDTGLLQALNIPTHFLPEVVQPGTVLGELLPALAQEVRLDQPATPVLVIATGTHDTASAVAGTPGLDQTQVFISSGTWSLVGVELIEPLFSSQALELNFTNEGGVAGTIRFLKNVMGLWLLQKCQQVWQEEGQSYSWETLMGLAEKAAPFKSLIDPDAPEFLNPVNMPEATRAYCQRTEQIIPDNPAAIIRCCLESLALKYRLVIEQLEFLLGHSLGTIRVVGGGSQNELLCQFTAEGCGREVIAGPVEATALGNIMIQAIATGQLTDLAAGREALKASFSLKRYIPTSSPEWANAYERFKQLIQV